MHDWNLELVLDCELVSVPSGTVYIKAELRQQDKVDPYQGVPT